jgi:cell cycle checkpoint protein
LIAVLTSFTGIANTITVRKHIILLEDLPNILHSKTQDSFRSSLQALVDLPNPSITPIVIIVSDSGMRGEADDEKRLMGGRTW